MKNLLLLLTLIPCGSHAAAADALIEPVTRESVLSPRIGDKSSGSALWKYSVAALAVVNVLDAHSSWGKRELNGTLASTSGTFGAQGAALKLGIQGGLVGFEYLLTRR